MKVIISLGLVAWHICFAVVVAATVVIIMQEKQRARLAEVTRQHNESATAFYLKLLEEYRPQNGCD